MKIAIASDHGGFELKASLKKHLDEEKIEYIDCGTDSTESCDYPDFAEKACRLVQKGEATYACLICGTGMGVAMAANKVKGIRAATAHDSFSVERLILSNNGQILCMGERVIGRELARRLAKEFFNYTFDENSPSAPKVEALCSYEED